MQDEDEVGMKQALNAMNEAWATPWIRELIERRERERLEQDACLARAVEDGLTFACNQPSTPASFELEAGAYATKTTDDCLGPVPTRPAAPTHLSPAMLQEWIFDRQKAEWDHASFRVTFQRHLKANFLLGCFSAATKKSTIEARGISKADSPI